LDRGLHLAGAGVKRAEFGMDAGAVLDVGAGLFVRCGFLSLCCAPGQDGQNHDRRQAGHVEASSVRRERRLVRSFTWPASWPQAPSMSAPRVLRMVVTRPACIRTSRKAPMRSGAERW